MATRARIRLSSLLLSPSPRTSASTHAPPSPLDTSPAPDAPQLLRPDAQATTGQHAAAAAAAAMGVGPARARGEGASSSAATRTAWVSRAAGVMQALAQEWRPLTAGSEGFLTGGRRGLEEQRSSGASRIALWVSHPLLLSFVGHVRRMARTCQEKKKRVRTGQMGGGGMTRAPRKG